MYMRVAEAVALTSSAKRLQVGAVAVKNNMVIGTGYNGLVSGIDGDCESRRYPDTTDLFNQSRLEKEYPEIDEDGERYKLVTKPEVRHAEANLLLNLAKSTESSEGSIIFCTHACCKFCAMDIVDSGAKELYYRTPYRDSSGIEYLEQNGVKVTQI